MQDDGREQLCATGLDNLRPLSAPTTEESLETTTLHLERVPLKRKSDEELGSDQKRRLVTEETQSSDEDTLIPIENTGTEKGNGSEEKEMCEPTEPERRVIIMKGNLPKLALPDGWIALNHRSGGIIYLHKPTRVVTWSRPYHIGGGSVRKHDVPLAAIPCLHQRRGLAMEKEKSESTSSEENNSSPRLVNYGGSILNTLNTGEKNTEEATPNEIVITEHTSVGEGHERSGLDVIMNLTDTNGVTDTNCVTDANGVTEKNDVTEKRAVTVRSEARVLNGVMEVDAVTESNGMTERCDVTDQSNVTQHSQVAEDSVSCDGQESSGEEATSKPEEPASNGSSSTSIELIDAGELGTYLSSIWEFQALTSDQERYAVIAQPQAVDNLELPASLECQPYAVKGAENKKQQGKECLLNAGGKTPVAILHEYCQRVLKTKPVYLSSECENADTPFLAEVQIDEIKYGSGIGSSKKLARQIAAECTLEVLLPGVYKKIRDYQISEAELEFFDKVDILDPRLPEFCSKTTLPNPSQILEECLKRNQGICSSPIQFTTVCGQDRSLSFHITCGKHTATGPCKNKRLGKQLASQQILKKLHPHLEKWGALIRIYCDRPSGSIKKYKKDESKSTSERENGSDMLQNSDLLGRLKNEMSKLRFEIDKAKSTESRKNSAEPVFTVDM
ncbi:hypothetical protein ACROYT_G009699 [Oculina patagonica]